MKQLFSLLLCCLLFAVVGMSQTMYWSVYQFEIKAGQETEVMTAMDAFFKSDIGKSLPYAALSSAMFTSSKDKWTHEVLFASPNKSDFGEMYSGKMQQSLDYVLLGKTMNKSTKRVASYLGKSVIAAPSPGNNFVTVFEMSISDPKKYLPEFTKMRTAMIAASGGKMGMDLHQFFSGNELGATHAAVVTAATFADLLDYTDMVFSSSEYASFASKVKDIRKILRTFTTYTVKEYNVPDGM